VNAELAAALRRIGFSSCPVIFGDCPRIALKAKTLCWSCWTAAAHREEVWGNLNTRITYKAVFDYYRSRLAQVGVLDHNMFREIIRAECRRRNRELESRADKAR